MEEDQTFQYTQFPNLNATYQQDQAEACLQTYWQERFSPLPDEVLILAWASLLQAFTRVSTPVFSFNGQPISVDISAKRWNKLHVRDILSGAARPTHLVLLSGEGDVSHNKRREKASSYGPKRQITTLTSVSFLYHCATGRGLLSTSGDVPESFLGELERQLLQMVGSLRPQKSKESPYMSMDPHLSVLNAGRKRLKGPSFLHELISQHWTKSSTAIDFLSSTGERVQISYDKLNHLADDLARRIVSQLSDDRASTSQSLIIPVLIPQCPELYCAWIAVLKANAAFCPIGTDVPPERMKYILKDVNARIVITLPEFMSKIAQIRPDIQMIEVYAAQSKDRLATGHGSSTRRPTGRSPDSLAYVMYTSGSTGLPKGVAIPHNAVTQALLAHDEHVPKFDRFLQFAAPTFDVSVFETFFPLFRGATLVTRHREHMLGDLPGTLNDLAVDAAELTPTVAGTLLRNREAAPSLRLLLTIGEMLTRAVIEEFAQATNRKGILLPMYGPTEASIHCTVASAVNTETKVGIIGQPLPTVTALIIQEIEDSSNAKIEVLPVGQVGELAVAGQLAIGYLNRQQQTEVSFRDHATYGRIYRTGDRARLLPNGGLECLGRISAGQVKIRGQRVELGEIEQVVCKVEGIQLAMASIIDDVLVVFCTASSKHCSREQIMSVCKSWLPSFMRPRDVVLLFDNIPRLPSGKIDKAQLEIEYSRRTQTSKKSPNGSQSQLEDRVIQCINAEMPSAVSPTDDLWSSGLDSLKAIKVASRLRENGLWLSVIDILAADDVAGIAKLLETADPARMLHTNPQIEVLYPINTEAATAALQSVAADLDMREVEGFRRCSPLQLGMLAETSRNSSLNFNSIEVRLPEFVSVPAFYEAFQQLAGHNKILRSGFIRTDAQDYPFCQIIWKRSNVEAQDHTTMTNSQSGNCGTTDQGLLHPLRLQLVDRKGKRTCIFHMHHALYDGWSFDLILQDLEQIISGQQIPQRPQFDDVLKYQLQHQLESASEAAHAFWRDHLRELRPVPFPKLLTKQVQRSGRQACTRAFTVELHDLISTCRTSHVSRQSIVSAAFAVLLSSYLGVTDIVFGAVSSGRAMPIQGIENIVGPCISTFPMRLDVSRLRRAGDAINSTHRQYHNFLRYEDVSLADIKTLSGIAGGDPLFDSLFVWQEGPENLRNSERLLTIVDTFDSLDHAVVLEVEPRDGKLQAKISFETSKISADHAMLFLNQLDSLLTVFARFPETLVRDCYSNMNTREISAENADFCTFDESFTLTSTIDALAREDPSRTAIEFVDAFDPQSGQLKTTAISYGELHRRSSYVSQSLATKCVSPDDVISLVMEKSIELYVAILGVIRSGAAYLAIDPRTPADRVRKILEDSRSRLVISEDLSQGFVGSREFYSTAELERGAGDVSPAINPPLDNQGGNLAYVVYTSGSTGVPKGVLITRSNVLSNIDCLSRLYPTDSESKLLQACSQAFDVSVFEIFFTWHRGMSLCVATNDMLFRDMEHLIRCMKISHLSLTPSVAALIEPQHLPTVKFLVTAGEPMNSKVFNSWTDRGLFQGYGPSETTNICNVRPKVTLGDFANNVGPPLPNTSIFICQGQDLSIVPRGAVGEVWIGGDQVGRGYLYNDELTKKGFLDHAAYGKLYRSGDIGRLLSDGSLVILGRDDDQVKLRGQRIELGDINQALTRSVAVKDAATLIVDADSNRDARLISFWTPKVPTSDKTIAAGSQTQAILTDLEARLPAYMIPDMLIPIRHVPLTKQGKVDRRALIGQFKEYDQFLLQGFSRANEQDGDSGPLSQDETLITQVIADVVGCASSAIHRDASFFALGMDSLNAIRLSQRLRKLGFGQVDISKIFRHASVRQLATYLSSSASTFKQVSFEAPQQPRTGVVADDEWQRHVNAQFAGRGYNVAKFLPTTPLQEVMLSSFDMDKSDSYQNELVFRISGDLAELEHSWKAMLSRHQLLRTGFAMTDASTPAFAQVVLEKFTLPWSWDDTQREEDLGDQRHEGYMLPPYSLKATKDAKEGGSTLTLRMHHALYDGEAMNLLLKEVETHYLGGQLPPVVPFDHYLDYMLGLNLTSIDNFWQSQLKGYAPELITEIFPSSILEYAPARFTTQLVARVPLSTLQAELKRMSTTLLATVQASWARLLSFYLQTFDVCLGNIYSGRSIPVQDADQIIGPCFNTLPVRVELKKWQTTAELIRSLQEINTAILPIQPSSLRILQKAHGSTERALFDTILLLQLETQPVDEKIWTLVEETGDMDFPMICEIVPDPINDELRLRLHVQCARFPASEACRLLKNFDILLRNDVEYTQALSRDVSVLNDSLPSVPRRPTTKAMPPSSSEHGRPENSVEEAFSSLEMKIGQILSEASETDITQIKKLTSIFQLGLDSINAIQIASRLRREGFCITGGDILEASTMERIAELCSKRSASPKNATPLFDVTAFDARYRSSVCQQIRMPPSTVEAILPCTSTQSGILAEFLRSDGCFYFNSLTLRLKGINDINCLKEAWVQVVARHEMLRTGFVGIENTEHPFAMIIYQTNIHQLPWKENGECDDDSGSDVDGKRILKSLHQPPWCLTYCKHGGKCLLKISILHALYDAQSLDLILADMAALYGGHDLPPAGQIRPTLSSIISQSLVLNEESASFFTNLGKSLQPTRFPNLRTHNNELHGVSIVAQSCTKSQQELRQGCRQAGMSLQTAVQCAWARVLAAYTGDPDITFGVILSSRTSEERMDLVAFPTMNTLPMPLHVSEDAGDLVEQAAKLNAALVKRQFAPLTQIKKWLNVKGSLFDTIVVLQQYPSSSDGTAFWEVVCDEAQTEHVVSLEVVPNDQDGLMLRLTFQRNVLPPEQAKILLDQYEALLYQIIFSLKAEKGQLMQPGHGILSILPAKESRIATSTRFLHEMVEQSARVWPERIALEFATSISEAQVSKCCWTFKSLNMEANKVAHLLLQQGTLPGEMIGICFDKCPQASFAILGIAKAGCAFVAIDPNAPEARKDFILKDSACTVLLCNKNRLAGFGRAEKIAILAIDDVMDESSLSSETPQLSRELKTEDTCYCLYTSGTTGQPKGCLITHDNAVQALLSFRRIFAGRWDENSRWLQFASFHFDVSVLEQFWSWSVGICVTSAPRDLLLEDIPGAIRALEITHLDLTPSLARLLKPEEVPSLCRGVFITGGEQLRQDVLDAWGDVSVLYNFYGPSEVTIGCTVHPRVPKTAKTSNIGQQFDNVGTFVLDLQTNQPVLRGGTGELCLSGPLVGKGYINRPELTKTKFEYLPEFGVKIYRTGDLVRLLHDGSFEFLGRADDQVKLRGQRLEIGEINHVLTWSDDDLQDVATMVIKHSKQSNEHLVSFLSWSPRSTKAADVSILQDDRSRAQIARIRQRCGNKLPGYMIPTYLVPVSLMPLSANNKVELNILKLVFANTSVEDLQRLATMEDDTIGADQASIMKITGLLSRRLGLALGEIRPSSSLFELGMDSVSIIGFCRSLKEAGFDVAKPSLVMRHSTVAGLAIALQAPFEQRKSDDQPRRDALNSIASFANKHRHSISRALGIPAEDIEKIAPCTPLQEGMISRTLHSDKPVYAPTFTYDFLDDIDLHRLQDAWLQAQSRYEILRTKFVATADGFAQVVLHNSDPQKCSELNHHENDDADEAFQHGLKSWQVSVKDFASTPWMVMLQEGPQRKTMVVCMFHALFDGISLPLLLENIARLYLGQDLVSPKPGFHDILTFGPLCATEGAKAFWQKSLASKSLSLLDLPVRHVGNAHRGPSINTIYIPHTKALDQLRFKLQVTVSAVFYAGWLLVLHKHFRTVPTLGLVVSGRNIDVDGAQNVIGPMFNTLPCLIEFSGGLSSSDLILACHKFNVDSLPFQHTAVRDISKWIRHDPAQSLFDSLFVFQREAEGLNASSGLWSARGSTSEPDFPLAVEVQQKLDKSFAVTVISQPRYLNQEEVLELLTSFEGAMHEVVENPDQKLPIHNANLPVQDTSNNPPPNTASSSKPFVWTSAAKMIREEAAAVAGVDVDSIRANSTIFELGLDSIDAIKLSARLKATGMVLSVSTIMRCAAIEAMAQACTQKPSTRPKESPEICFHKSLKSLKQSLRTQGIQVDKYEKVLPVTPLQEGMLANVEQYYSYEVLEIAPEVDLRRLHTSWKEVICANPILRTSFVEVEDPDSAATYAQLVHKFRGKEEESEGIDWRELVVGSEPGLDEILREEQLRFVRLGLQQPMLNLMIVKLKTSRFLVLSMAHAIYDGWSISLLHQDVSRRYSGNVVERPHYGPALRHILHDQDDGSRRFWNDMLGKVTPSLFPRHAESYSKPALTLRHEIRSVCAAKSVQDFCKARGVTAQALGLTCYSIVLASLLRKLDVCFGLVLSGRTTGNFEEMMFPTMNTVVFHATLEGSRSEMLKAVHDRSIQISERQFFSLRKAKALCGVEGALFDALFIYQKKPQSDLHCPQLYHSIRSSSSIEYPVNVEMEFDGTDLVWRAACQETVLNEVEVSQMLTELDRVLAETMKHPNEPVVEPRANKVVRVCRTGTFEQRSEPKDTTPKSDAALEEVNAEAMEDWSLLEKLVREVLASVSGVPEGHISKKTSLFSLGLDSISSIKVSSMLRKKSISLPVSAMLAAPIVEKMAGTATQIDLGGNECRRSDPPDPSTLTPASEYQEALENLKNAGIMPENVESIMPVTAGQDYVLGIWRASGGRLFYSDFFYKSIERDLTAEQLAKAWAETVQQLPILRSTFMCSGHRTLQIAMKSMVNPVTWFTGQEWPSAQSDETVAKRSDKAMDEITKRTPCTVVSASTGKLPPKNGDRSLSIPVKLFARRSSSGVHVKLSIHHALYDAVSLPAIISTLEKSCRGHREIEASDPAASSPSTDNAQVADESELNDKVGELTAAPQELTSAKQQRQEGVTITISGLNDENEHQHRIKKDPVENASTIAPGSPTLTKFITWTRSPTAIETARAFWTNYLASGNGRPTRQPSRFASRRVQHYRPKLLDAANMEKIARSRGLSFQSLFIAAYASVHTTLMLSEEQDPNTTTVTIGIYLANRSLDIEGLARFAYPTFNVVPLRIKVSVDGSLFEIAENIQNDLGKIGLIENCGVSLREIYEWTGVRIDCCLNFLKLPEKEQNEGEGSEKGPRFESVAETEAARSLSREDASSTDQIMTAPSPFTGRMPSDKSEVYLVSHS